jgi:hypothetical protein
MGWFKAVGSVAQFFGSAWFYYRKTSAMLNEQKTCPVPAQDFCFNSVK